MKIFIISNHWLYLLFILFYSGSIFPNELTQPKGAVVTSNALATKAGEKILAEGGNAYDAATTISAMLSVVEPFASGLGGGAFWLIYDAKSKKYTMLDARETAPLQSHKNMYHKTASSHFLNLQYHALFFSNNDNFDHTFQFFLYS